jgi:hypothetical protein
LCQTGSSRLGIAQKEETNKKKSTGVKNQQKYSLSRGKSLLIKENSPISDKKYTKNDANLRIQVIRHGLAQKIHKLTVSTGKNNLM